jgi:histidinol-phosphate phosphatase family protein
VRGRQRPRALLCDCDGTLIRDVPYNGDATRVEALPGVGEALARARGRGLKVGIVSNQRGLALGAFSAEQLAHVQRRVAELLGPFDLMLHCPHDADEGCSCRKPQPGMILEAARRLGVGPQECAVIGDTAGDVDAAAAAGARAVLVPNAATDPREVREAAEVRATFGAAVDAVLEWT